MTDKINQKIEEAFKNPLITLLFYLLNAVILVLISICCCYSVYKKNQTKKAVEESKDKLIVQDNEKEIAVRRPQVLRADSVTSSLNSINFNKKLVSY